MRFPSWTEITSKLGELEKKINDALIDFKEDHPLLDKVIQKTLPLLPPPFNAVAENIYSSFQGSPEDKSEAVLKYFVSLKKQGEEHYNQIVVQLDNILGYVDDIKKITAKQDTVEKIQQILISNDRETKVKLDELKMDMSIIIDKTNQSLDSLAAILFKVDKFSDQLTEFTQSQMPPGANVYLTTGAPQDQPHSVIAEKEGNIILFKRGQEIVENITADDMATLDPQSKNLIEAYEKSMESSFRLWTIVYPQRNSSPDPLVNARVEEQLRNLAHRMCYDLKNIFEFLNSIGKYLEDHYNHVRHICDSYNSQQ